MNNFGVIEIASTTTKTTPGWAYVPDTGPTPPAALQPTNRKRAARNQPALSLSDLSAREETRLRKDLEALDRDSNRDVNIPIPPRPGANSKGDDARNKHTPNVRKILQSQKTFANHLDDYHAMLALAESNPAAAAALNPAQAKPSTPSAAASKSASPAPAASAILPPYGRSPPPPHPGDADPLLVSRVPPFPSDDELRALMTAPPLSYLEARAGWDEDGPGRYPVRVFCAVCGYWGRVKCMKCGTRVCALDCLEAHREECVTRYGL
ncbi:hypothetical protein MYCTH_2136876 [Thermothelomyces thermophilus ATCC 42464]|uniref:HIT-type domain-containing protein n=1 Tax=Thermothelomyces thermophilus (strain ATCC 42464 / BCRC 31852 / DSM 1799) TaxID=573729 RepID=G2PZX0_THET4|nr:uncharacterized protein MYCTH_2136876 [Thermothelomyces thermophilus ATCC 42464]AEO53993.1 hypothetical protein MYCTH_2136876 [Thermothelomyces thermophilus ATCC 42464]